jgi:hypothetical protein
MDKDKEGILGTATSAVVDSGAVVVDTAKAGLEGAKDIVVTAGTAVGDAVSAAAKKARKAVSRKPGTSKKDCEEAEDERTEVPC